MTYTVLGVPSSKLSPASLEERREQWAHMCSLVTHVQWLSHWNALYQRGVYHPKAGAGNSLTQAEVARFLSSGQVGNLRSLRDYDDLVGYRDALGHVGQVTRTDQRLTEADLCFWHGILMRHRPYYHEVDHGPQGVWSYWIHPGQYRRCGSSTFLPDGRIWTFAPPSEVPGRMKDYVAALHRGLTGYLQLPLPRRDAARLLVMAHWKFALIHPFDNGNGRLARLLVFWLAQRMGFPPFLLEYDQRPAYIGALATASVQEDIGEFRDLMAALLSRGLDGALALVDI